VLSSTEYISHSFDKIRENFIEKNVAFFKAVYFDFAPLLAIPVYQERPVHSLHPIENLDRKYSLREYESLANRANTAQTAHPCTKTQAILKASFAGTRPDADVARITAYSYDIVPQTDFVPMLGGDGRIHSVAVPWDQYIPLEYQTDFLVADAAAAENQNIIASKHSMCIYH
jgi:hypothetical protein